MAQMPSANTPSPDKEKIKLHIKSPTSPAVTFADLPVSTSIATLKRTIYEASPTHPPVTSQRLIYGGHPIVQDEKTLKEIFTQATINSSDFLTLHLVTPPQQPRPHAAQVPSQPQPVQSQNEPQLSQGQNGANAMPQPTQPTSPPNNMGQQVPPQQQFPPHLQQHFQHFQALQAQLAAQMANLTNHPIMQGQPPQTNDFPMAQGLQQPMPPQLVHQNGFIVQNAMPHQPTRTVSTPEGHHTAQSPQPNVNVAYREHIGPNGQRWYTRTEITQSHVHQHPHPHTQNLASVPPGGQGVQSPVTSSSPPISVSPANPPGTLRSETPQHRNTTAQSAPIPLRAPEHPDSSAVYLLSAPNGRPHALLVSPSGNFTAPWPAPVLPDFVSFPANAATIFNAPNVTNPPIPNVTGQRTAPIPTATTAGPQQNAHQMQGNAMQVVPLAAQANPANAAAVNQQQRRDLGRIVLPLAGHLWLLIRLFGFVYFFTHGASLTRTLLLCSIATLVFMAQLGFFRGLWEPLRRHADNLLAIGGNEQPNPQPRVVDPNAGGVRGPTREPTPQEAAQRLLGEREQQNGGLLRQSLRRAERATALFLASLAPGVAERHIRAREAAEAARQQDIREREEREKKEAEEAKAAQEAAISNSGEGASVAGESGASTLDGASQGAAQPPLIEV